MAFLGTLDSTDIKSSTLYTPHCTALYSAQCTHHTAYSKLYNVQCTVYIAHCKLNTDHHTVHTSHCKLYRAHWTLTTQQCSLSTIQYTLTIAVFTLLTVDTCWVEWCDLLAMMATAAGPFITQEQPEASSQQLAVINLPLSTPNSLWWVSSFSPEYCHVFTVGHSLFCQARPPNYRLGAGAFLF